MPGERPFLFTFWLVPGTKHVAHFVSQVWLVFECLYLPLLVWWDEQGWCLGVGGQRQSSILRVIIVLQMNGEIGERVSAMNLTESPNRIPGIE